MYNTKRTNQKSIKPLWATNQPEGYVPTTGVTADELAAVSVIGGINADKAKVSLFDVFDKPFMHPVLGKFNCPAGLMAFLITGNNDCRQIAPAPKESNSKTAWRHKGMPQSVLRSVISSNTVAIWTIPNLRTRFAQGLESIIPFYFKEFENYFQKFEGEQSIDFSTAYLNQREGFASRSMVTTSLFWLDIMRTIYNSWCDNYTPTETADAIIANADKLEVVKYPAYEEAELLVQRMLNGSVEHKQDVLAVMKNISPNAVIEVDGNTITCMIKKQYSVAKLPLATGRVMLGNPKPDIVSCGMPTIYAVIKKGMFSGFLGARSVRPVLLNTKAPNTITTMRACLKQAAVFADGFKIVYKGIEVLAKPDVAADEILLCVSTTGYFSDQYIAAMGTNFVSGEAVIDTETLSIKELACLECFTPGRNFDMSVEDIVLGLLPATPLQEDFAAAIDVSVEDSADVVGTDAPVISDTGVSD